MKNPPHPSELMMAFNVILGSFRIGVPNGVRLPGRRAKFFTFKIINFVFEEANMHRKTDDPTQVP